MVAFTALKAGDILYEVHRTRSAQARSSRTSCFTVKVIEVHDTHVMASWNMNPPQRYSPRQVLRWRRTPPKAKA